MTDLPTPFVKVNDVQLTWGRIPNMAEAEAACPEDYPDRATWERFVDFMFETQLDQAQIDELNSLIKPEQAAHAADMNRYTSTWIKSFDPDHSVKLQVAGWCYSQFLREPPSFVR